MNRAPHNVWAPVPPRVNDPGDTGCSENTSSLGIITVKLVYAFTTPLRPLFHPHLCSDLRTMFGSKQRPRGLIPAADVRRRGHTGVLMVVFSAFGGLLFGHDIGTISGVLRMDNWLRTFGDPVAGKQNGTDAVHFALPTSLESVVVSILFAGTFFGALSAAPVGDVLGRRIGTMLSCLVFSLGVALQTGAPNLPTFILGRFFAGSGVGLVSTLVPIYQSECAPKWIRGFVIASYQWAVTIGTLVASVINNATKDRRDHSAWRIPIALQLVWAFLLFVGMLWLPESPRWLIKRERDIVATRSLARLTNLAEDHPEVQAEVKEIRAALKRENMMGRGTYQDCFRSSNKTALRTCSGIAVLALQQLAGVVFISSYGTTFFADAGIKNPFFVSIVVNIVQMGMAVPGLWGVEKLGRRPLLIGGGIAMALCGYTIAILGVVTSFQDLATQKAVIGLVCVYFAAYATSWGPVGWVVPNEIIPLNIRAKAMSLSVAIHWLCTWAVSFASPYLANSGPGDAGLGVRIFFIWGSTTASAALFTYLFIPETSGVSLEQIDLLYENWTPGLRAGYRPSLLVKDRAHVSEASVE
ncbi:general substrate transporter [Pilatotrama ljubarskyi]|nr:general substrate transporter [Pilatotrama ljubarskyi]